MLVIFGFYGYQLYSIAWMQIGSAILLPALVLAIWRIWAAPKSNRQLPLPYLILFRSVLFMLAAYLLYDLGQTNNSIVFGIIAMITQIIALVGGKSHDAETLEEQFMNRK